MTEKLLEFFRGLAFSPNGHRLAAAGDDRTVKIWDTLTGEETLSLHHPEGVSLVKFASNGERLATVSNMEFTIRIWDARPVR